MASAGSGSRDHSGGAAARSSEAEAALRAQAREFTRLTAEVENDLFAHRGDPHARERLVEHNLDLVVAQADEHRDRGLSFADLYQEGTVGLIDAVEAYDGRGTFREFASLHIGLQMDSLIEAETDARKRDEDLVADCRALDLAQAAFRRDGGRDASEAELAGLLGWDVARTRRAALALDIAREENDASILGFLDDADIVDLLDDDLPDPRRRLPGHGPDD